MRGKRPLLALAIALIGLAIFLPDWTVTANAQDTAFGSERIGWGLWGGHACPVGDYSCRVVNYDEDVVKDDMDRSTFPRWCHATLALAILLEIGLAVLVVAERPRPWLRTGVLATAGLALATATLAIHARPPSADAIGAGFPLFVAGAVLGFAIAARVEPSGELVKPT
jgi:hypothetical protein